ARAGSHKPDVSTTRRGSGRAILNARDHDHRVPHRSYPLLLFKHGLHVHLALIRRIEHPIHVVPIIDAQCNGASVCALREFTISKHMVTPQRAIESGGYLAKDAHPIRVRSIGIIPAAGSDTQLSEFFNAVFNARIPLPAVMLDSKDLDKARR